MNGRTKKDELMIEAKSFFDFYKKEIGESIRKTKNVIFTDFMKLAEFSKLSDEILSNPEETLSMIELAIEESGLFSNMRVRLYNLPKSQEIKIGNIRSRHLNELIVIEGIIRQASDVRPQVVNAKFECPSCGTITSVLQIEKKFREPSRCSCGRRGGFRLISKEMVDTQRLVIEESPESLSGGEQPKRLNVFVKEDLVEPKMEEKTTPGSRIKVIGVLKEVPVPLHGGGLSTRFELAIEANNVIPLEETFEELDIGEEDERQILELSQDPKIFDNLARSIAPSIYGYEEIKKSLVLQLFGGLQRTHADGTRTRGDIHILLIGDPGVAKSQVLGFIANISPKGRYVVGKSTSGAGLTATVVRDEYLRGWSLEAGAMVLANKGLVAIDELEKMDPQERGAMHEAMEQQCYLPDFKITLADGSKIKIGKFIDSLMKKNKEKIEQGINCKILSLDEDIKILTTDFEKIYPSKISRVSKHTAPDKFVKIKLNNGKEVIVTPEHPCWIIEEGHIKTIPAKNLKSGDFFPIPAELPIKGKEQSLLHFKNSPQLCKILGYHISDGGYELNRGKKNGIQFWNNDKRLIDDYFNSAKELFNITPIITKRKNQFAIRIISKKVVDFFNFLDRNLMNKCKIRKIPEKILKCKKEDIAFLLRALFDGDGTVINVKRNGCRISLISENKELANQVTELLLRFGITSSIYKDKNCFRVDICGQENLFKFYQNIGFLSEKKQNRLQRYLNKKKTYRSISDVVPHTSKTIRKIFRKLKINSERDLGNQICMECNKHRIFLQKMINVVEKRINLLIKEKENIKNTLDPRRLGEIRKILELSALSISKKLGISDYMLKQKEKKGIISRDYQKILLEEIEEMLSIIPKLKELKKLAFGKIRWSKIKSIKTIENKDTKLVYDLTVEPTHAFISNNMILHNSVTISKANVQAHLRSETSVLAAANPKFGRFDPYQPIAQQIDLPPTLLNRFDIIFTLKDVPDREKDEKIASHVLKEHQKEGETMLIPRELFRKYIAYAKQKIKPILSDESVEEIKKFYIELRNRPVSSEAVLRPIPISARQLQALIRMAEASAKIKLSETVTKEDAKKVIEIMKYYLTQAGYDYETKTFDIDRISGKFTSSQRNKIFTVRDTIIQLEERLGKMIPIEEIEKELEGKLDKQDIEDALNKLSISGDIFNPRRGYVSRA